jgi:hypothetical protein
VVTDPGCTVGPFGRTTPDDPGTAPIECVPTTAIIIVVAGLGLGGCVIVLCGRGVSDDDVEVLLGVVEEGPEERGSDVASSCPTG